MYIKIRIYCWNSTTKFWDSDSYAFFHDDFSHNCHGGRVFPKKMKKMSVTDIALKFLIFLISVMAVTVKSVTGSSFITCPLYPKAFVVFSCLSGF